MPFATRRPLGSPVAHRRAPLQHRDDGAGPPTTPSLADRARLLRRRRPVGDTNGTRRIGRP